MLGGDIEPAQNLLDAHFTKTLHALEELFQSDEALAAFDAVERV